MTLNPFNSKLDSLVMSLTEMRKQMADIVEQKTWFEQFDASTTHKRICQVRREIDSHRAISVELEQRSASIMEEVEKYLKASKIGLDPSYWFSSLRMYAKCQYDIAKSDFDAIEQKKKAVFDNLSQLEDRLSYDSLNLSRYQKFDVLSASATMSGLNVQIKSLEKEIHEESLRKEFLDRKLSKPACRLEELKDERDNLLRDINRAKCFRKRLSEAPTSRDRAILHHECEVELGDSNPNVLISKLTNKFRHLNFSINKLEKRIKKIVANALRDIRHLVIDGNNLCYKSGEFIGLQALDALIPQLATKYKVTLIFDPCIRYLLGMSDSGLKQRFPGAEVQVVPDGKEADSMIIDVAGSDLNAFIISCDKFVDYPEKEAVAQCRIIPHVIVNDMILIEDLDIEVQFVTVHAV